MSTKKSTVVKFSQAELAALLKTVTTQSRVKINPKVVGEYAEAMKRGDKFPPLIVYKNRDGKLVPADGFHRASAAIEADLKGFDVEVRQGTEWDALLYSGNRSVPLKR